MTSPPQNHEPPVRLTDEERTASEWVREFSRPRARESFREALRREFASGAILERPSLAEQKSKLPIGRILAWVTMPAAAAAALFFVAIQLNQGPAWTVVSSSGAGDIVVDGTPIAAEDWRRLDEHFTPGSRVEVPEGMELELLSEGQIALQITGGTEIVVPTIPGRWWDREAQGEVAMGEVRVMTGPAFDEALLRWVTPEADIQVTGTTFAVIRDSSGTCVCAYEGTVLMGFPCSPLQAIPVGKRRFQFNDGRPVEVLEIDELESQKLGMFHDQNRTLLSPGS